MWVPELTIEAVIHLLETFKIHEQQRDDTGGGGGGGDGRLAVRMQSSHRRFSADEHVMFVRTARCETQRPENEAGTRRLLHAAASERATKKQKHRNVSLDHNTT